MKNKIIISIMTVLLVAIISIANVPTTSAYVPVGPPWDPPLDPGEIFYMDPGGMYSFNYGHHPNYGSYLRDFQWLSPGTGWDRYMGLLSVPNYIVNGVTYTFAVPAVAKAIVVIGPSHCQVIFSCIPIMDANGDTHNFQTIYDIWHTPPPPISPIPGTDLRIDITITDTVIWNGGPGGPWTFIARIRSDFDIADLISFNMDDVYVWAGAPPAWTIQFGETVWPTVPPGYPILVDPTYGMAVMQNDAVVSGVYPVGPWGGIVPFNVNSDIFHILANNGAAPLEYLGPPAGYVTGQTIGGSFIPPPPPVTDIVVWDETNVNIPIPGIPGVPVTGTLNPQIWLR